jgi:glycosyltransferase involved in cell wall biosynthesis
MFYDRTAGTLILKRSARIIAVSRAVARHVRALGGCLEKTDVIPNGVDRAVFSPSEPRPGAAPTILFVGRLAVNKGPQVLIDALPRVLERFPETQVHLIGDGPLRRDLERSVQQRGMTDSVRFLGTQREIEDRLRSGDIFVLPSLMEGLPLTVLEAMACGLPVIATAVGGTVEIVEEGVNGYLVRPGEPGDLASRLCDLLGNARLRREMGREGERTVERGYDWDTITQRTIDVYRAVAHGRVG